MPWHIEEDNSECDGYAVIKDSDGSVAGCHESEEKAKAQMAALYASEEPERVETYACECIECGYKMDSEQHCAEIECPECGGEMRRQERPGQGRVMGTIEEIWAKVRAIFERELEKEREWSGSASNYASTEAYCSACLIDVNAAAGRDEKAQSHCMLPVKRPGSSDYAREGIQAAAGGHGITQVQKPSDVPGDAWSRAVKSAAKTLVSQYKKLLDRDPPEAVANLARAISTINVEQVVFTALMADPERHVWPVGLYFEKEGMYAVVTEDGKLYRVAVKVDGDEVWISDEWKQVAEVHQSLGRTVVRKAGERWRWFSVSATAVLNRVGEIDSRALFDSFIAHAEETGEYPKRDFYHLGETFRTGQVDFMARDGNVLVTSGLYDDTELGRLEVKARQRDPDYWGDSIAYRPSEEPELVEVGEGVEVPVYQAGVVRFVSTVPRQEAASLFTMGAVQEVNRMLEGRAFQAFSKFFEGEEDPESAARAWLEANVDETNRAIEESGAITRAVDEGEPAEPEPAQETEEVERADEPEPEPIERELELDEEALGAIVERVVDSEEIQELQTMLENLSATMTQFSEQLAALRNDYQADTEEVSERLAALEKDEDQKREEWVNDLPRKQTIRVTHRPREANDPKRQETMADRANETLADMPMRY